MNASALRAVVAALGLLLAAPSSADELTDSLASIRRAMVGHWSGTISGTNANNGETFEEPDAITFAVTSDDGLDSATWSAEQIELATYQGDGRYLMRSWNKSGRHNEIELGVSIVESPDASGDGSFVLEDEWTNPDGDVLEVREQFSLAGDTLRMTVAMRPAGSDEPFETTVTGTWSRQGASAPAP